MLNVYKYYDDAKSLLHYNEIGDKFYLLKNTRAWGKSISAEDLEPLKNIIIKRPVFALRYAKDVIKGRWPESEHLLIGSMESLYYVNDIMDGDWSKFDNGKHVKDAWYHQDILITIKEIYKSLDRDNVDISEVAIHPKLDGNVVSLYDDSNGLIGQIIKSGYKLSLQNANRRQVAVVEDYRNTNSLYDIMYDFIVRII